MPMGEQLRALRLLTYSVKETSRATRLGYRVAAFPVGDLMHEQRVLDQQRAK